MKRCSNCFQEKPLDQFYKKLDRYQARCKSCNTEVCFVYRNRKRPRKVEAFFAKKEKSA